MTETQLQQTNANLLARRVAPDDRREKTIAATLAKLRPIEVQTCACGGDIVLDNLSAWMREHATMCEACAAKDASKPKAATDTIARGSAQWCDICPPLYRETDIEKLPCSRDAVGRAMRWRYGARGLVLHGPTGTGKSRVAWLVLEQQYAAGRTVDALSAMDLSFRVPGLYAEGADHVDKLLRHMCGVDVMLLDDCFKAVLNDRTETFLFALLSHRSEHHKPVISTLNDTSESLKARLTADKSEPLLRRMTDYAETVYFGHQTP